MANEVKLTFAGDSTDLERAFDKVGAAADSMASDVKDAGRDVARASDSFDNVGEAADGAESKFTGVSDSIEGTKDAMEGWGQIMEGDVAGGIATMSMGMADLASGISNLIVPLVQSGVQAARTAVTWVTSHASMAASSVATAASAIASWIATAAASVVNAAIVAASWLLAFAPVIIVIAIVVGLVVLIIKYWDEIKAVIEAGWNYVKDISSAVWEAIKTGLVAVWDAIKGAIQRQIDLVKTVISTAWDTIKSVTTTAWGLIKKYMIDPITQAKDTISKIIDAAINIIKGIPGKVTTALSGLANALTAPFRAGFDSIKSAWNNTIGGKGISFGGSWGIPKVSFTIPKLAEGGIVTSPTLALIGEAGPEAVVPLSGPNAPGGGPVTIVLQSDGSDLGQALLQVLRKAIKNQGGGVVQVLG